MHLVIIGGGAAGSTAALEARKHSTEAEITIISEDRYPHYSPCGLPFVLSGKVREAKELIVYPPSLYRMSNIELHLQTTAECILPHERKVLTTKGSFSYDTLIIATGSSPIAPQIQGEMDGIFTLKTIDDGERILGALRGASGVVIVGAGLIGLEVACALIKRVMEVRVVELKEWLLPSLLDREVAEKLRERLERKGIKFHFGTTVEEIVGKEKVEGVLIDGEVIRTDLILFAMGVRPNVELAKSAGLEMGESGGIKVNERMETSVHSIYAAGDCVDSIHLLTGKSTPSMLGSTATREGRVAGVNAVGGNLSISPLLNTTISDLDGVEVGSVGLNRALAKECGFSIVEAIFEGELLDPFLPSEGKIVVKMVGDKPSGKVIGVQILGEGRVWGRILATSFAMQKGITADELASAETAYVPSISPTFDPITITADLLSRKMKGEYEF